MTSPELAEVEAEVGLGPRTLYVRGRSAVLGELPPKVAADVFGIFPGWMFDLILPPAIEAIDAAGPVWAYLEASARWSRAHLSGPADPESLAELVFRLIDAADAGGLALVAGWQQAERPSGAVERVGLGLAVLREYRGGLHFAALRAVGLTVPEAIRRGPRGWPWPSAAHRLVFRCRRSRPRGPSRTSGARWRRAEDLTDARMGELIAAELTDSERAGLGKLLQ